MTNIFNNRSEILLLVAFILVNILMYSFSYGDDAALRAGADSGQYLRPARSLVDYGTFTMNPPGWTPEMSVSQPFTFGTPLYSILLAVPYFFFEQTINFYITLIIIQCSLLYFIGWLSRGFLPFFNSRRSILIHTLVIFNPNSLTTAHLIQSETLFTLFVVTSLLFLFKYIKYGGITNLIFIGISAGLLTLTRPAGLYLVYMIPVIIITIKFFQFFQNKSIKKNYRQIFFSNFHFLIPVIVAFLVMSPWYARNYINTNELFLTSESGAYIKDNYTTLIHRGRTGLTEQEAFNISDKEQLKYFIDNGVNDYCYTNNSIDLARDQKCSQYVFDAVLNGILNESFKTHARALFHSWGVLYFSGGASNFRNYIGLEGSSLLVDFQQNEFHGLDSIIKLIKKMEIGYFIIFLIFTSFAVISRAFGLIGFYRLLRNSEKFPYLIAIIGVLAIFTAMYLYLGQSRFRVPLEPILTLMTILAFTSKKQG